MANVKTAKCDAEAKFFRGKRVETYLVNKTPRGQATWKTLQNKNFMVKVIEK